MYNNGCWGVVRMSRGPPRYSILVRRWLVAQRMMAQQVVPMWQYYNRAMASNIVAKKGGKDWRRGSLADQLWYMYQNNICTDLEIRVNGQTGKKTFKCHRMVIARLSATFQSMVEDSEDGTVVINLNTMDPNLFSVFIRFAYQDKLVLDSMKQALEVHRLAADSEIVQIYRQTEEYISTHMNKHTVWELLDYAPKGSQLMMWAKSTLGKETKACLSSENFLNCRQKSLNILVNMKQLNLPSELDLVLAVIRWAKYKNGDRDLTSRISRELLGPCLSQVRFLSLSAIEFSEHVARSGLLSSEECLAILVNLSSPGQMVLPNLICKETRPREKVSNSHFPSKKVDIDIKQEKTGAKKQQQKTHVGVEEKKQSDKKVIPLMAKKVVPLKEEKVVPPLEVKKEKFVMPLNANTVKIAKGEVVIQRGVDESFKFLTQKLEAPTQAMLNFQLSRDATLTAVSLTTQVKKSDTIKSGIYREGVHVMVRDMATSKQVAYQTFHGDASYGPGKEVQVSFTTPGHLKSGEWYSMMLIFRSAGFYEMNFRPNLVVVGDLKAIFNKDDNCARSANPLTALILKV